MIEFSVLDLFNQLDCPADTDFIFPEPAASWLLERKDKIVFRGKFFRYMSASNKLENLTVWTATNYSQIQLYFVNKDDEMYFKLAFV